MRKIGIAKAKSYFKCYSRQDRVKKRESEVGPPGRTAEEKTLTIRGSTEKREETCVIHDGPEESARD